MKLNLCIDKGNTRVKVSLFHGTRHLETHFAPSLTGMDFSEVLHGRVADAAIYCGVAGNDAEIMGYLQKHAHRVLNVRDAVLPIAVTYSTPQSLGSDRIAAAVGARTLFPEGHLLVVDAGSALTIDLVDETGFAGGLISPGVRMRLRALHEFTGRLPLVEPDGSAPFVGDSTETCIRSGVLLGVAAEIDAAAERNRPDGKEIKVVMTGGDAVLLQTYVKNEVIVEEHLLAKGLNRILLENEHIS